MVCWLQSDSPAVKEPMREMGNTTWDEERSTNDACNPRASRRSRSEL